MGCLLLGSLWRLMLWFLRNVARNSLTCISNVEIASLELQRFWGATESSGTRITCEFYSGGTCRCFERLSHVVPVACGPRRGGHVQRWRGCPGASSGLVMLLVVVWLSELTLCSQRSPPRRITVKMGCCGRSGLHCERKDERCGVFGGARGGQYQHSAT